MIGFPLRVNYNQRDYIYYVITPPSKKNLSIEILLDGKNYMFTLSENNVWMEKTTDEISSLEPGLVLAISRAITQRYHI